MTDADGRECRIMTVYEVHTPDGDIFAEFDDSKEARDLCGVMNLGRMLGRGKYYISKRRSIRLESANKEGV